ncbi:aldehyde dehydrogenase (NADP(+)) [Rhodohalobacter sulfatireducens]|uniref:Aldehyde dehydrogenase (NADP(+)) n=1 Tax=Rhodohalobacter sulfatireducens TaxID=2911366 RepID=A0ABS9KH11_9BACT|nr:aldehyde dehydrogenase (NADP(+)) [Rhodohalobacter sulfatireducens]MCG2590092.1 aldehyde dehydrogenase (NADP(+)) [Rhodohalobacter sulfatireducens]
MSLHGQNFIGNDKSSDNNDTFQAVNPATKDSFEPPFHEATEGEVNHAAEKAADAFLEYSKKSASEKADFLDAIGDEIMELGDALIERCMNESGLSEGRLNGERGRTVNQLKLFADVVRDGSWVDARIDTGDPDVRSMRKALGPVGVFGASNFPLAFSVAGGDTASALAAGCPIVVKAHPSHPGTCELVAEAIMNAAEKTGMPDGVFSMVHGTSNDVGLAIVRHPKIKAVGFTGSYGGGKALFDEGNNRPEPIPVYAEMGSTNPVFILPGALKERKESIAEELTGSVSLGVGQFCTNPGLVFHEESDDATSFQSSLSEQMKNVESGVMLNEGIQKNYQSGLEKLSEVDGVEILAKGNDNENGYRGSTALLRASATVYFENQDVEEEVFGPSTVLITSSGKHQLIQAAQRLRGHLTATIHGTEEDLAEYSELVEILEQKVGRIIFNGYPTGVRVCHAMIHGGPFPATTDSRTTSVGTTAMRRFARPVCYQDFPNITLPDELKDENPRGIWRLLNGEISNSPVD